MATQPSEICGAKYQIAQWEFVCDQPPGHKDDHHCERKNWPTVWWMNDSVQLAPERRDAK